MSAGIGILLTLKANEQGPYFEGPNREIVPLPAEAHLRFLRMIRYRFGTNGVGMLSCQFDLELYEIHGRWFLIGSIGGPLPLDCLESGQDCRIVELPDGYCRTKQLPHLGAVVDLIA